MPDCCVIQGRLERPVPFGSCWNLLIVCKFHDRTWSLQLVWRLQESLCGNHDTQDLPISQPRSGCWTLRVS